MNSVKQALFSKLAGTSAITTALGGTAIYEGLAPQETDPPYILYSKSTSTPAYMFDGGGYEDQTYLVKVVTQEPSMRTAGSVAELVDAALTDGALTLSGRTQMFLRREADVEFIETDSGVRFNHSGATYRVITQ